MDIEKIQICINLINKAIEEKTTLPIVSEEAGFHRSYVSDKIRKMKFSGLSHDELFKKYNDYLEYMPKIINKSIQTKKVETEYDAEKDDDYDNRSIGIPLRESDEEITIGDGKKVKKISGYYYKILVRNQEPLEGYLTREEMDLVYRLYSNMDGAGLNQRTVSRYFKNITFRDFKRILRAFNITKSSIPVAPHVLEEKNELDLVDLVLKNKENNLFKRIEEKRSKFNEKRVIELQKQLFEYKENEKWIDGVMDKYFERNSFEKLPEISNIKQNIEGTPLLVFFSDIHFGKKYDEDMFQFTRTRGYNKDIAKERILKIAEETINESKLRNYSEIVLIFGGDLLESAIPEGMHPEHFNEMDEYSEKQIFTAVDVLKEMVLKIKNETNLNVEFYGILGNHDRIQEDRDQDKRRVAGLIALTILQRELSQHDIKVEIPKNNLLRLVKKNVLIFLQHGDSGLRSKKFFELNNLFGEPNCYSIILQGHFHSYNSVEYTKGIEMRLPSVASPDKFIVETIGSACLPGFLIGHQPDTHLGFDFRKITLY